MPAGCLRGLVVLRLADLQGTNDALVAQGVKFSGPPAKQPWGMEAAVHDPDGNEIVLRGPEPRR
jgi:predicted enzyme related to lactoylglutathione lyase